MSKIKNILIMLMIISALSIVPVEAQIVTKQYSSNPLTAILQKLSLVQVLDNNLLYTCSSASAIGCSSGISVGSQYAMVRADAKGITFGSSDVFPLKTTFTVKGSDGQLWGSSSQNSIVNPFSVSSSEFWAWIPITIPDSAAGMTTSIITQTTTTSQGTFTDTKTYNIGYGGVYKPAIPTPTPTATPNPIPKPTIIPPAISRLIDSIWSSIKTFFGLTIVGGQSISTTINQPYSTSISLAFAAPDNDYSDGSYQAKFGQWFVSDSNKNILAQSPVSAQLTTSPWTTTATFTPSSASKFYLIAVIIKQQYTWTGSTWTVSESVETQEVQEIVAKLPAVTTSPVTSTPSGILASLSAWLKSLFSWLPW